MVASGAYTGLVNSNDQREKIEVTQDNAISVTNSSKVFSIFKLCVVLAHCKKTNKQYNIV